MRKAFEKRLGLVVLFATLAGGLAAQKAKPKKDDPEVAGLTAKLAKFAKDRKAAHDGEGVGVLDKLAKKWPGLNDKQRKQVAKAVGGVFKAKRGPDQVTLLIAAAESLSRFGKLGAEGLAKQVENRAWRKKSWLLFKAQLVYLLGRPAEPSMQKLLVDVATRDKDDDMVRAKAGEALGFYAKHDQKTRKEIARRLISAMSGIYSMANKSLDPTDQMRKIFLDRYNAIQDPWMKTLTKLTGQRLRDPVAWETWFNDAKHENWDKKGYGGVPKPASGSKSSEGPRGK